MPKITQEIPRNWKELEEIVKAILQESGMKAEHNHHLDLPRGKVNVDVYSEEEVDGIVHRTIYECKNWSSLVPQTVVHAFRTVVDETGVNRGYVISKKGFQSGAKESVKATNIELVTFEEFQKVYFSKWINKRIWAIENTVDGFHTYYEPTGKPGYSKLKNEEERLAYDCVWDKYFFAAILLQSFSPYLRMMRDVPFPSLPFDCSKLDDQKIFIPEDIRELGGYREFLASLEMYAIKGVNELRKVNPITKNNV
ncbi:MAG: restriction endonuclease [Pseudomonadota bacterium]